MGLKTFINNFRYLFRYNIKTINTLEVLSQSDLFQETINSIMDNLEYELPYIIERIEKTQRPIIKTYNETIDELITTNKSFVRFGDGELFLMNDKPIPFQEPNPYLQQRLENIIKSSNKNIMIGIIRRIFYMDAGYNCRNNVKYYDRSKGSHIRRLFENIIDKNQIYYAADITAPFMTYENFDFESYYNNIQRIWKNKDITIICGVKTFENIDYNIFECSNSLEYQYAPSINAFDKYKEIFINAKKIDKNKLIIIILGPTATILAYDLAKEGFRAIDIGHIAKDYDAYKKKVLVNSKIIKDFFGPEE